MTIVKMNRQKASPAPPAEQEPLPQERPSLVVPPKSSNPIVRAIQAAQSEGINVEQTPTLISEAQEALDAWKEELSSKARQLIESWQVLAGERDVLPSKTAAKATRATSEGMQERVDRLVAYLRKHPLSRAGDIQREFGWGKSIWAPTAAKAKEQGKVKQQGEKIAARWSVS